MNVVRAQTPDGTTILLVDGEVDMDTAPHLWSELKKALGTAAKVQVKLTNVRYIDSSGIAILVQAHKQARRANVSFSLLDPSPPVMAVLELAQLTRLFTITNATQP